MAKIPASVLNKLPKYKKVGEALSLVAKDNPKDKIEVVLGDDKSEDFKPQIKIQKWDNEANVSIRLKDNGTEKETVGTKDGQITWAKGNKEVHFYHLPESSELPEGGYEFEVILKEKPDTNIIEFTLVDKDVEYFYQPPLNQEKLEEGQTATETQILDKDGNVVDERPINVVGSYAVYTKSNKTNYVGGKEYKCGKVGHIYRPRIEDVEGTKVWGELHIENEILSVTIPQDFLDKAVYPVIVDPTFGYETAGGSTLNIEDLINGYMFTGANGTATSITASLYADYNTQYAIYLHSDLSFVAKSGSVKQTPRDWKTSDLTTNPTLSAVDYILVAWGVNGVGSVNMYYDSGSTNYRHYQSLDSGSSVFNWPDPLSPTHGSFKTSIYCTYTAGGETTTSTSTSTSTTTTTTSTSTSTSTTTTLTSTSTTTTLPPTTTSTTSSSSTSTTSSSTSTSTTSTSSSTSTSTTTTSSSTSTTSTSTSTTSTSSSTSTTSTSSSTSTSTTSSSTSTTSTSSSTSTTSTSSSTSTTSTSLSTSTTSTSSSTSTTSTSTSTTSTSSSTSTTSTSSSSSSTSTTSTSSSTSTTSTSTSTTSTSSSTSSTSSSTSTTSTSSSTSTTSTSSSTSTTSTSSSTSTTSTSSSTSTTSTSTSTTSTSISTSTTSTSTTSSSSTSTTTTLPPTTTSTTSTSSSSTSTTSTSTSTSTTSTSSSTSTTSTSSSTSTTSTSSSTSTTSTSSSTSTSTTSSSTSSTSSSSSSTSTTSSSTSSTSSSSTSTTTIFYKPEGPNLVSDSSLNIDTKDEMLSYDVDYQKPN